uniref:SFRICE_005537 n=1 Tax=Spodoptera frugiperda TaxID=7108 RepID=A0A2H1VBG8_SPOFR
MNLVRFVAVLFGHLKGTYIKMRAVILIALFLCGTNALPEVAPQMMSERQARIITDQVIEDIEDISQAIRDMGLDPLLIEHDIYDYELPVPVIFNAAAELIDIRSFGLSDIVIEDMSINILQSRLDFRVVLPHIHFSAKKAKGEVTLFGETLTAELDGTVDVRNIDAIGHANYLLGLISGISIPNVDVELIISQITSKLQLTIQGTDIKMRVVTLFALVLLGVNALPEIDPKITSDRQARFIVDQIIEEIENIAQSIRDMGLDPLAIEHDTFEYALPVPALFNAAAEVEDVRSFGLSNIVVEHMDLLILAIYNRLDFHIALPHIHFFARKAKGLVDTFGEKLIVEGDGSVDIRNVDIVGRAYISLGISGITVSGIDMDFKVGRTSSNIRLAINGQNFSEEANRIFNTKIPNVLDEFSDEINELLEIILIDIINENL